jgi:hypothetical protein
MRAVPVVLVGPWSEPCGSFRGVLVATRVGPFADSGLDEAFGFSVGTRGVDAGALVGDAEIATGVSEAMGVEARPVVGEHPPHRDAEPVEVGCGLGQEAGRRVRRLVRIERRVGDARVVVHGDVEELPACAAGFVLRVAGDAMTRLDDAGELLDVEVQQIAGGSVLVANHHLRLQHLRLVQLQPRQDAADGSPAQAGSLRDPDTSPTLAPQPLPLLGHLGRRAAGRPLRTRRTVLQPGQASLPIAPTHLPALCRLSPRSAAASRRLNRPSTTLLASCSRL